MKALRHLNKYFWKYKGKLLLGLFYIVLTNILTVYSPQLINEAVAVLRVANEEKFEPIQQKIKDGIAVDKDAEVGEGTIKLPASLKFVNWVLGKEESEIAHYKGYNGLLTSVTTLGILLAILYSIVFLVKGVFLFYQRQTIIVMSRYIEYDLKNEVFDQYQKLSPSFYKMHPTGDIMNRISEDVSKVRMYLGPAIMYTLNLVVIVIMVVYVMFLIDVELTLYALTPLPLLSVSIFIVSKRINEKSDKVQQQQSLLSTMVQESMSGIRVLKAYNREAFARKNFEKESNEYKKRALSLVKVDALFMPIIMLLVGLSTILTIYIGGIKVVDGSLELEHIFQFVFYVNMLTWPFASVGWVTSLVQQAEASQQRINNFLTAKSDVEDTGRNKEKLKGDIEFRNVSFKYPDSGIQAISDLSFVVKAGETIAVLGRTGSGKSTLANLLNRLYEADSGEILLDGKKISSYQLQFMRSNMGYVPQEVFLFSDSVRNNIAFGLHEANQDLVIQAAKDADIHDNIMQFPSNYDTQLGERGINLSGGQKQRISIARAIIRDPSILIFDDCLSAVDTQTEEKILQSLKRIMKGKTSVIISHRVSSIKHADKIIVLERGKIVEQGNHESLISKQGLYAELHRKQLLEEAKV
jgi:ATP-binding cassette subfamily B protein